MSQINPQQLSKNLKVPTLPTVVQKLGNLISDPDTGPAEVGAMIGEDPPLSGRVLRIANSSFYGLAEPCTSVGQACTVLGLRMVHCIVLQTSVIKEYERLRGLGIDIEKLWRHSILVAQVASMLSKRSRAPGALRPSDAYVAGLLHDVGQIVLLDNLGAGYVEIMRETKNSQSSLFVQEQTHLATTHAEIGATATGFWGLPQPIVQSVRAHHSSRHVDLSSFASCLLIKADTLVHRVHEGKDSAAEAAFDERTRVTLGIQAQHAREAIQFVQDNLGTPLAGAA